VEIVRLRDRSPWVQMFAVNHLGHFLLTTLLLDRLKEAQRSRVVVVASDAYRFCRAIRFDDLQWNKGFNAFPTYGHSKPSPVSKVESGPAETATAQPSSHSIRCGAPQVFVLARRLRRASRRSSATVGQSQCQTKNQGFECASTPVAAELSHPTSRRLTKRRDTSPSRA